MHQLPGILHKLKNKFPNCELTVSSGTSQKLVDRMMHGEIDTAFVSLPVDNANITTESIFSDEIAPSRIQNIRSQKRSTGLNGSAIPDKSNLRSPMVAVSQLHELRGGVKHRLHIDKARDAIFR